MAHKLDDKGRRDPNLNNRRIQEVLPEWFVGDNPKLINFFKAYYELMDSDGIYSFSNNIHDLQLTRDTTENETKFLNEILKELGTGLTDGSTFIDARWSAKRIGELFRLKGTRFGAEEFFREFYQQEGTEIIYPKNNMFIVGESEIGYESLRYITDYARYQVYSLLIKTGLDMRQWETLFKRFCHPAGFHLAGDVVTVGEATGATTLLISDSSLIDPLDFASSQVSQGLAVHSEVISYSTPFTSLTGLMADSGGAIGHMAPDSNAAADTRIDFLNPISKYTDSISILELNTYYQDFDELIRPSSLTFDDSASPMFSSLLETMDNEMFKRYTSDSAF